MTLFYVVGGIGVALLVISLVFGDLLDMVDAQDFGISGVAVGAALASFGAAGLVLGDSGLMIFLSIVIALLLAWGVQAIVNHLARNEVSSIDYSVLGLEGVLTATTGPTSGEVRLDDSREVEKRMAMASEYLEVGTRVRVIDMKGPGVVVEPVARLS